MGSADVFIQWFEASFPQHLARTQREWTRDLGPNREVRVLRVLVDRGETLGFALIAKVNDHTVWLDHFKAEVRRHGQGRRMLALLCTKADELSVFIQIMAIPGDRQAMTKEQLIDFYRHGGFEAGLNCDLKKVDEQSVMLRRPSAKA